MRLAEMTSLSGGYMIVYRITNRVNGKMYIGQTIKPLSHRWTNHVVDAKKGSDFLIHKAIRKHGAEAFDVEVLCVCSSEVEMNDRELHYTDSFNTVMPQGYNMKPGGNCSGMRGKKHSLETKQEMSASRKGHPNYLLAHSEETKRRIGIASTGRKIGPEGEAKRLAAFRKTIALRKQAQ
jgi:group I intron endonuclease